MRELSAALQSERELLDHVRFRFIETRLLLTARETRYLAFATAEIEQARLRVREADLLRAAHLHRLEAAWGNDPTTTRTLREIAAAADEPWAGILRDHHDGLSSTVSEIEVIGHRNAELARASIHRLAEGSGPSLFDGWLQSMGEGGEQPATDLVVAERLPKAEETRQLVDERAYQDVITTASRLRMPALLAFLR